jgi:hypothetical protein
MAVVSVCIGLAPVYRDSARVERVEESVLNPTPLPRDPPAGSMATTVELARNRRRAHSAFGQFEDRSYNRQPLRIQRIRPLNISTVVDVDHKPITVWHGTSQPIATLERAT